MNDRNELTIQSNLEKIFSEVQNNLPTLDFDSSDFDGSSSEEEEDINIFNRTIPNLDGNLSDNCEDDALSSSLSGNDRPINNLGTSLDQYLDERASDEVKRIFSVVEKEISKDFNNSLKNKSTKFDKINSNSLNEMIINTSSKFEQTLKSKSIVSDIFATTPTILNGLEAFSFNDTISDSSQGQRSAAGSLDEESDCMSLIEKLAMFSSNQSGECIKDIDPATGAPRKLGLQAFCSGNKNNKTAHNTSLVQRQSGVNVKKFCSASTNTEDLVSITNKRSTSSNSTALNSTLSDLPLKDLPNLHHHVYHSAPSRPTEPKMVFIDLRNSTPDRDADGTKNMETVKRVLGISSDSKSSSEESSDEESDMLHWHEQRKLIKKHLQENGNVSDFSKITKNKSTPVTIPKPKTQAPKLINLSKKSSIVPKSKDLTTSVSKVDSSFEKNAKTTYIENNSQKQSHLSSPKDSKPDVNAIFREQFRTKLEEMNKENGSKIPSIIFDPEVSFESPLSSLPAELTSDTELLLLSVNLSSNNEISFHRNNSTNKRVDPDCSLSATFPVLLSWFMSLVPENSDFLSNKSPVDKCSSKNDDDSNINLPFIVLGLQQIYIDGQLYLYIAISPSSACKVQRHKKTKGRGSSSLFHQHVSRFLVKNTLQSVFPIAKNLIPNEIPESSGYTYTPTTPSISSKPLSTYVCLTDTDARRIFNIPFSFFWNNCSSSVDNASKNRLSFSDLDGVQCTMSLVHYPLYTDPLSALCFLHRIQIDGLDICGVRLAYRSNSLPSSDSTRPASSSCLNKNSSSTAPVLAIALRGHCARSRWLNVVGPADPVLARRTDPESFCARYGGESKEMCPIFCARTSMRVQTELVLWFGTRVDSSSLINHSTTGLSSEVSPSKRSGGTKRNRKSTPNTSDGSKNGLIGVDSKDTYNDEILLIVNKDLSKEDFLLNKSLAETSHIAYSLNCAPHTHCIVATSPLLPIYCLGFVLDVCQQRGFQLCGVCRFSAGDEHMAATLGVNFNSVNKVQGTSPISVILLSMENAGVHLSSLLENLMLNLMCKDVLAAIPELGEKKKVHLAQFFEAFVLTDTAAENLTSKFSKIPNTELMISPRYSNLYSNKELEQIIVISLRSDKLIQQSGHFLSRLLFPTSVKESSDQDLDGQLLFELLALKLVPKLTWQLAKEMTPYEVGDPEWKKSVQSLTTEPVMLLVLRSVNAYAKAQKLIDSDMLNFLPNFSPQNLYLSPSPELTYRYITMFFSHTELFPDHNSRPLLPFIPPEVNQTELLSKGDGKLTKRPQKDCSIFSLMLAGPKPLLSVLVAKPDVVKNKLIKLIKWIYQEGFLIVAMRLETLSKQSAQHITPRGRGQNEDSLLEKMNAEYLTKAPSLIIVLQRENCVKKLVDLCGELDPRAARISNPSSWRGVFGSNPVQNGLYVSSSYESAIFDVKTFFPSGICYSTIEELNEMNIHCLESDETIGVSSQHQLIYNTEYLPTSGASLYSLKSQVNKPLTQTNCIVLTPPLTVSANNASKPPYINIIDHLITQGFEIVGLRMVLFSKIQEESFSQILESQNFSFSLTKSPSIVLALQKDNAVLTFESHLGSNYSKDSILSKYGDKIIRPKTLKQSQNLLLFFFKSSVPGAHSQIIHKN